MRLILEGGSGVGKSTLARALATLTGVPVYRPFRGDAEHISSATVRMMQGLGLSVNGWEEDLYTADVLSVLSSDVIIDRSMPSAMAHNEVSSCALDAHARRTILRLWAERIVKARAVLVLVACEEMTRVSRIEAARIGSSDYEWEVNGIVKAVREAVREVPLTMPGLEVWRVNTSTTSATVLADALARRAYTGRPSTRIDILASPDKPGAWATTAP